jgi:hypothetical protein
MMIFNILCSRLYMQGRNYLDHKDQIIPLLS